MTDKKRETASDKLLHHACLPREIIEDLIEKLRKTDTSTDDRNNQVNETIRLLDQCIVSRKDECTYADAVERAPWLTADIERLKRQWKELRHTLHELYKRSTRGEGSPDSLIHQFTEFAERFVDCEADEQCVLQAAFPGPSWTDENQKFQPFEF